MNKWWRVWILIFIFTIVGISAATATTWYLVLGHAFRIICRARRYTMLNRIPQEILACRVCIPRNNLLRSQGDSIFQYRDVHHLPCCNSHCSLILWLYVSRTPSSLPALFSVSRHDADLFDSICLDGFLFCDQRVFLDRHLVFCVCNRLCSHQAHSEQGRDDKLGE